MLKFKLWRCTLKIEPWKLNTADQNIFIYKNNLIFDTLTFLMCSRLNMWGLIQHLYSSEKAWKRQNYLNILLFLLLLMASVVIGQILTCPGGQESRIYLSEKRLCSSTRIFSIVTCFQMVWINSSSSQYAFIQRHHSRKPWNSEVADVLLDEWSAAAWCQVPAVLSPWWGLPHKPEWLWLCCSTTAGSETCLLMNRLTKFPYALDTGKPCCATALLTHFCGVLSYAAANLTFIFWFLPPFFPWLFRTAPLHWLL